jgi:HlyD family secretion protein
MLWIAAVLVVAAIGVAVAVRLRGGHVPHYVTEPVQRGSLVQTVTAEGTVNPQNLISVGTQVSGTISELDVDYNSPVRTGQVMAKIDPTTFRDALNQARASRTQYERQYGAGIASTESARQTATSAQRNAAAAQAALASAAAQVGRTKAARDLARLTVRRDGTLLAHGYIAQNQYDADTSNAVAADAAYAAAALAVDQARAQLEAQQAIARADRAQTQSAVASASATSAQADAWAAQVDQASYNLRQSVIVSPVNGTVIARNVSVGQTVAASFQTPTLFTIAQDLSKMEVDISVGEPDIGGVRAGDVADFTVLAYPNRTFHGVVYQVRRNPTTQNNVVTYDTVVYVENRDGALYPGMTANASIHVAKAQNALIVPVAALQYAPPQSGQRHTQAVPSSPWGATDASATRTIVAGRSGRLFVLRGGVPAHVPVRIALVSGAQAAIVPVGTPLRPGDPAIVADDTVPAGAPEAAAAMVRSATSTRGAPR